LRTSTGIGHTDKKTNGNRKRFVFRLEDTPAFCIVSHILSLAIDDKAFRRDFRSVKEIFDLEIPAHKEMLKVKFKSEKSSQPIFRDVDGQLGMSGSKALPYQKARDHLIWLGRVCGFEDQLEFYDIRRGSGKKLNGMSPHRHLLSLSLTHWQPYSLRRSGTRPWAIVVARTNLSTCPT
jgi:hypothetical protein